MAKSCMGVVVDHLNSCAVNSATRNLLPSLFVFYLFLDVIFIFDLVPRCLSLLYLAE